MIGLILLLAQTVQAAAHAAASVHWVRLDGSGWATAEPARPESLRTFERLWNWSPQCGPVRLETAAADAPCSSTRRITVHALGHDRRPLPNALVVWTTRSLMEEVPDDLLPRAITGDDGTARIEVASTEPAFVRIAGPADVSEWRAVDPRQDRAELRAVAGTDVAITAIDERRQAAKRLRAMIFRGDDDLPIFVTADEGMARFRVAASGISRAVIWADETAPIERIESNGQLSGTITLPHGCGIRGTVIGRDGKPVADAGALITFALGKSGHGTRRRAVSGADGRFELTGVPSGTSLFSLGKKSLAPIHRELTLASGTVDLGRLVLAPATTLPVVARDSRSGRAIAGVKVRVAGAPIMATTDANGLATLDGIGADAVDLQASAEDYLPATAHVEVPAKKPAEIRMTLGATFRARVVRAADRQPAGPGTLLIDLAGAKKIVPFGGDGTVRVGGLGPGSLSVDVRVPGFTGHKLPARDVAPGDSVDFGMVLLETGTTILGTVVDAATAVPIQARIRLPRPNPSGPRLSLVMKDWIETSSDDNGRFELHGLAAGDYRLLVEAPGYAPALTARVAVGTEPQEIDAGTVTLARARKLSVVCKPARRCGAKAQLLLGDPNDDWATVSAPIHDGKAELLQTPPGRHQLQLLDRGALVAEREVAIADDAMEATVEIALKEIELTGEVRRGGRPVDGGSVQFVGQTSHQAMPVFVDRKLDSTVVDSEIVGIVPRTVLVDVDAAGRFRTRDLGPGTYTCTYSGAGGTSRDQEISIPDASSYEVRLDIPATSVRGHIADEKGRVPDWARVELRTAAGIVSADMMPDGQFAIDGAPSGTVHVRAFNDAAEAERDVVIAADRETELDLALQPKEKKRITITALEAGGAPRRAARLFLLCDGALTTADADTNGTASFPVAPSARGCLGAGFSAIDGWAFTGPMDPPAETSIRFASRPVTLAIQSPSAAAFAISVGGFPMERAFPLIGWPAMATPQPVSLRGVPPGTYLIRLGSGAARSVVVDGTKDVSVTF